MTKVNNNWEDKWETVKELQEWKLSSEDEKEIKSFISTLLHEQREETIEYISFNQGWEETGDKYREHFGLPIKYKKEKK